MAWSFSLYTGSLALQPSVVTSLPRSLLLALLLSLLLSRALSLPPPHVRGWQQAMSLQFAIRQSRALTPPLPPLLLPRALSLSRPLPLLLSLPLSLPLSRVRSLPLSLTRGRRQATSLLLSLLTSLRLSLLQSLLESLLWLLPRSLPLAQLPSLPLTLSLSLSRSRPRTPFAPRWWAQASTARPTACRTHGGTRGRRGVAGAPRCSSSHSPAASACRWRRSRSLLLASVPPASLLSASVPPASGPTPLAVGTCVALTRELF